MAKVGSKKKNKKYLPRIVRLVKMMFWIVSAYLDFAIVCLFLWGTVFAYVSPLWFGIFFIVATVFFFSGMVWGVLDAWLGITYWLGRAEREKKAKEDRRREIIGPVSGVPGTLHFG